jgi:hypothetical protein
MTPDQRKRFEEAAESYADSKDRTLTSYHTGLKQGFLAGIEHATKWIDCKERLPEFNVIVLVYLESGHIKLNHYCFDSPGGSAWYSVSNVTHWQPLPSPPSTTTV